jgi:hypothetical protein
MNFDDLWRSCHITDLRNCNLLHKTQSSLVPTHGRRLLLPVKVDMLEADLLVSQMQGDSAEIGFRFHLFSI